MASFLLGYIIFVENFVFHWFLPALIKSFWNAVIASKAFDTANSNVTIPKEQNRSFQHIFQITYEILSQQLATSRTDLMIE